ncbi:hypothetical protein M422DRAFT_27881 [Sphaerobolus stellatus SS14]|nr:hypothetical protein M422DRAFT_27881 [Sphaerobolus stellatus SS14]
MATIWTANAFRNPVFQEISLWQATFLDVHLTLASLFLVLHTSLSINYVTWQLSSLTLLIIVQ